MPIAYMPDAVVLDPKPEDRAGAVRQRARWLKGQFHVIRSYPSHLLRLLVNGPKGWSLLASGLLKPRTLILPVKIAAVVGLAVLAAGQGIGWWLWAALAVIGIVSIGLEVAAFLYALHQLEYPVSILAAIVAYPAYFLLWMKSLALT
ncbi:MAG: hypothetical protein GTO14_16305, partial [Anaerolineales bacterium]|nr:hypothetical protein [Anaerolineales bacterium]